MSPKFEIVEDTFSSYLNKLIELVCDENNSRNFIKDAGAEMHFRYIEPEMPKWNPNLMYSPLESRYQKTKISDESIMLDLIYTGFTETAEMGALPEGVWSEFGDKNTGTLERDYALYQETGKDEIAPDFAGHHFVQKGTYTYSTEFHYKTMVYIDKLMRLERWQRQSNPIDLYDYMV